LLSEYPRTVEKQTFGKRRIRDADKRRLSCLATIARWQRGGAADRQRRKPAGKVDVLLCMVQFEYQYRATGYRTQMSLLSPDSDRGIKENVVIEL
jgi:hypothetical protein